MDAQQNHDIRGLLLMLARHLHWLIIGAIFGSILGLLSFLFLIKPDFTAEAKVYTTNASITASLATDPYFLSELIDSCHLDLTWQQLKNMLEVSALPGTNLISIRVTSKSRLFSVNMANTLAAASARFIQKTTKTGFARVLTTAVIPSEPSGLTSLKATVFSGIGAGGLTALALLLWSLLAGSGPGSGGAFLPVPSPCPGKSCSIPFRPLQRTLLPALP